MRSLNITLSQCYNKVNYKTFWKQKLNIKFKLKRLKAIKISYLIYKIKLAL